MKQEDARLSKAMSLLNVHYASFKAVEPYAHEYGHPEPCDTRGWSQLLVSILTGLKGIQRQKGADLEDGSDVKGACTWGAIDTPRFNGCIKAGTKSSLAGRMASLDREPYIFFVLWDHEPSLNRERCRIWVVRPQKDKVFREMCARWYNQCRAGEIKSTNFQLHPPRNKDSNVIRNTCGNLEYPLFFAALKQDDGFVATHYDPAVLTSGQCVRAGI